MNQNKKINQSNKKIKANIWKYYVYRFLVSFTFTSPIFILFLQENGLNMTEIMILNSVFTGLIMLSVVPFGLLADKIGRKAVITIGGVCLTFAWILYAFSYTFNMFLIGEALFGVAIGAFIAANTAFFYDTVKQLGKAKDFKKLFGKATSINGLMWGIGSLVGAVIATYGMRWNFYLSIIPVALSLFAILSFTEPKKFSHGDKKFMEHLKDAVGFAVRHPKVRLFIIYSMLSTGTSITVYLLYQPYLKELGIPLIYFGIVYACLHLCGSFGCRYGHLFDKKFGEKKILIGITIVYAVAYLLFTLQNWIVSLLSLIAVSFMGGMIEPVISDYIHKNVESHHRATISSLNGLLIQGFSTALAPLLGWLVDVSHINYAFALSAMVFVCNLVILLFVYMNGNKNRNNHREKSASANQ